MKIYCAGNGGLSPPSRVKVNCMFNGRMLSYFEILIHPGDKQWKRAKWLGIFKKGAQDGESRK